MHGERSRKVKALTKARYVNTLCGLLCDDAGPCHRPADVGVPYGIPVTPVFQYEQAELPRGAPGRIERDSSPDRVPRYPAFLRVDNRNACGPRRLACDSILRYNPDLRRLSLFTNNVAEGGHIVKVHNKREHYQKLFQMRNIKIN